MFITRLAHFSFLLASVFICTGCQSTQTRSFTAALTSSAMGKLMNYSVYTPPDWHSDEKLPLVVLLHGGGGDHLDFDRYEVDLYLDAFYRAGVLPRVVIANPDGELGFWENWADGSRRYRDWVMDEMVPAVQTQFNTARCPDHCHIMGVSMGGHGALRFAYYESDSFASVSAISALVLSREAAVEQFSGLLGWFIPHERIWGDLSDPSALPRDVDPFVGWTENRSLRRKSLYLAWGSGDRQGIRLSNKRFAASLDESGLEYTKVIFDGDHKWVDWRVVIADAIQIQLANARSEAPSE